MNRTIANLRASFFVIIILICSSAVSCESSSRPAGKPHIILISADTLRGDFFTSEHMPETYSWASRNALIYTNAHSTSTWTKPAHVTLLSGIPQHEHGIEDHESKIPEGFTLIQESLRQAGYSTHAFVGGGYLNKYWGFIRGFDTFFTAGRITHEPPFTLSEHVEGLGEPFRKTVEFLGNMKEADTPHFIFIHSYEMHEWFFSLMPPDTIVRERTEMREIKNGLLETPMEHRRRAYAGAASSFDARLFDLLECALNSPLSENLYIIITSDHGEGLGERYGDEICWKHTIPPYAEQTHVPLIVCGGRKGISDRLVGLDDVAGVVLAIAGLGDRTDAAIPARESVRADYIAYDHSDNIRYVVTIEQKKRDMVSFDDESAPSTSSLVPQELNNQLKALGYLN